MYAETSTDTNFRDIYSVSRLNREVRSMLETGLPLIWLEGEISNLAKPGSGHLYFSLKDEAAQVRCAMFRNRNYLLGFTPKNGMQILVRARISLYEPRGEFQIVVDHMEAAGDGALRRAFDQLKQRLNAEGLFDSERKRALPAVPACVGVITSPTGAAIHDILTTLNRRYPNLQVIIYPTAVQGKMAAGQIVSALQLAERRHECDVLILARGGGSLEDLWPFNEEVVAHAIAACTLPIVSGVGHDIDFTIADFVADRRAATPTAAAELVSPDQSSLQQHLEQWMNRLHRRIQTVMQHRRQQLTSMERRLQHPGRRLQYIAQRLDEYDLRLQRAVKQKLRHEKTHMNTLNRRLWHNTPTRQIHASRQHLLTFRQRLTSNMRHQQTHQRQQLESAMRALHAVSPLATLDRGYAIISDKENKIVLEAKTLRRGEKIDARLKQGRIECIVEKTYENN